MKAETMKFINSIRYDKEELEEVIEELRKVNDKLDDEIAKKLLIQHLESMVHKRMSISQMELYIKELYVYNNVKSDIKLVKSVNWDNYDIKDYNLIGSTEKMHHEDENIPFCDFDIYVLPTKEINNDNNLVYYITEVGYEF